MVGCHIEYFIRQSMVLLLELVDLDPVLTFCKNGANWHYILVLTQLLSEDDELFLFLKQFLSNGLQTLDLLNVDLFNLPIPKLHLFF